MDEDEKPVGGKIAMDIEKALEMKEKYTDEWMKYDDVFAVGVGYKIVDGVETDTVAVRVYTTKKKSREEIAKGQLFPQSIETIPIDVIESKQPEFLCVNQKKVLSGSNDEDPNMYRPMVGGIQISHLIEKTGPYLAISCGTVGLFVRCKDEPEGIYMLTNWHVLSKKDMDIYQPWYDGTHSTSVFVGTSVKGGYYECADAGIAKVTVSKEEVRPNKVLEVGEINGVVREKPQLGDLVKKRGRTTQLTHGRIIDIDYTARTSGGNLFQHQILMEGIDKEGVLISRGGDSGSAVFTYDAEIEEKNNQLVGLLWGGIESHNLAVCSPINYVFDSLNIELF